MATKVSSLGRDEDKANDRLIAAAPELLSSCESMVEIGCEHCGNSSGPNCIPEKCLYAEAKAAIAKAKGEELLLRAS